MHPSDSQITLTILISTSIILFFGVIIIYFLFKYQKKRHQHQKELLNLKETFDQTLLRSKLEIQEQTLNHISKEIHANISQLASLINIHLTEIIEKSDPRIKDNLIETKTLTRQLMSELKEISATLNTDFIIKIGFVKAMENEISRFSKALKFPIMIAKTGDIYSLSPEAEIILFRLCQEVLNNAIKHSKATEIKIQITYTDWGLQVTISDNGSGFDTSKIFQQDPIGISTGLVNIQRRAKTINADVDFKSGVNLGTKVTINVPK